MPKALRPQQEKFFHFISGKSVGDFVTDADIMTATGWSQATVNAYRTKNIFDPFLAPSGPRRHRVLRDGATISKGDIGAAFTQKRPGLLVLTKGMRARGAKGEYELRDSIGEGAVAHVWEVRDSNGNAFAIKVMNPRADLLEPTVFENVKQRFSREHRHGMTITHPHIVAYHDIGEIEGHPFIVMHRADKSLAQELKVSVLSVSESLDVIIDCARGLEHLHRLNCIHRDIKPANILRCADRYVLGDLGIVRWSDMNKQFTSAGTITRASVQLGSWYYMSPEQRMSPHEVRKASDIYALGVSWVEMLTGETPDPSAIAAQAIRDPSSNPDVNALIKRMLRFVPEERPTIDEVLAAAVEIRKGTGFPGRG